MTITKKELISEAALFSRVNRQLRKRGHRLCRCSTTHRSYTYLGRFYTVDTTTNTVIGIGHSLAVLAADLRVIGAHEVPTVAA